MAIDAPAARTAGHGFTRRTLLGWSLAASAVPLLAGCGDHADDWTITGAEVQKLQDSYARATFQAFRTRNRSLIKKVETGALLQRDLDAMALADRLKQPRTAEEYTFPDSVGHRVAAVDGDDRQRLITVSEYSNTAANWRNLGLYVRAAPSDPWLRAFSGGLYASDVPDFGGSPIAVAAADSGDFAAEPRRVPGLVAGALQDPGSADADRFTASDVRQRYADDLATQADAARTIGTVTRRYRPGGLLIGLEVEGGCLVLGSFSYTQTVIAKAGQHVTFKAGTPQHEAYAGRYAQTTSTFGGMFAAMVPTAGKLTLVSAEERQTGLTAS